MNKLFVFLVIIVSYPLIGNELTKEQAQWLKEQMSAKHQQLIPKVMVADIYFACNLDKKIEPVTYPLSHLIYRVSKAQLSEKLISCLGSTDIRSEQAINYGLLACFSEQFSNLTKQEQQANMQKVHKAIASLSVSEKQQSFLKCTTQQAVQYIE